ncbi:MAG: hypothetical protein DRI37_09395 [Chloroflexi bacterium]|nr:MAG: hypothetical protein DRI37_09395 [Chloroflexota bacterium]
MLLLMQSVRRYISTNLNQPHLLWLKDTAYAINTTVVYENHIYRTIVDKNKGVQPDLNTGKWLLFGVDNAFAAIDLHSSTSTTIDDGLSEIELKFDATNFNHLAFGGVQGGVLTVEEHKADGTLIKTKDYPIGIARINAQNWYNYYYLPIPDTSGAGSGLPIDVMIALIQPTTSTITVKLTRNSALEAFIGSMVGGKGLDIGDVEYGVNIGLIDYSRKETDEYGITTLVRRKSRQTMTCDVVTPAVHIQGAKRVVQNALGHALMFVADPDKDSKFENLIMLGYIEEWETYLNNGVIARSRLRLEEVL